MITCLFNNSYLTSDGRLLDTYEAFYFRKIVQVLPLALTRPRDSYGWNYREVVAHLALSNVVSEDV